MYAEIYNQTMNFMQRVSGNIAAFDMYLHCTYMQKYELVWKLLSCSPVENTSFWRQGVIELSIWFWRITD